MRIVLFILSLGLFGLLGAQNKYSKKPDEFIKQFREVSYKSANETQKAQIDSFVVFWNNGNLTANQQKNIILATEALATKRQRPIPSFPQIGNILRFAKNRKNANEEQMDTLSLSFSNAIENNEPKKYLQFLKTLELYTKTDLLFDSKSYKVYAKGSNFDFKILDSFDDDLLEEDYQEEVEQDEPEEDDDDSFDSWDTEEDDSFEDIDWGDDDWGDDDEEDPEISDDSKSDGMVAELYKSEKIILSGPVINFKNTTLTIISPQDTVEIHDTEGDLSLTTGVFSGFGGNMNWSHTGASSDIKATFSNYSFNTKKPEIEADDVLMHHPDKLSEDVKGIFEYKYVRYKETPQYPRFMSYKNDIEIKDFPTHISYKGGFAMNGSKVFSSCASGAPSTIIVSDGGEKKFTAKARYFELGDSVYKSNPSFVILYFGADSIGHPGARLIYNDASKFLSVRKDLGAYKEASFSNSYHALDMDVDQINWVLTDSIMTLDMVGARNQVPAYFESELHFSETKYIHLKGYFAFHPLQMIMNYCKKKKKKEFTVDEVAIYYKQKPYVVKTAVSSLYKKGFVAYNHKMGTALLTEKAFHYYSSRRKKTDYDVLSVKSVGPSSHNGVMDMSTYDLTVEGVDKVLLSDSNDVRFFPNERKLVIQKNRNILFDGIVTTNNYVFNGRDFKFSYDSFNLDLVHIDSIEFSVDITDTVTGQIRKEKIDNKLTYSEGVLSIDKPTNKSGLKKNPRYPHFDADHGAAVLFNKREILDGVYDTSFRYQIPPFAVDSLSGDIESTVSFDGEFYSGGVFPTIKQPLEVQKDNGFGFTHQTPEEGYPIFGGEAQFLGTITLGKNGLRGDGKLVYLNTTLESMDFVFYKDSVKGLGDIAHTISGTNPELPPEITFPECLVKDYEMAYYPSNDSMHITNYENAIEFYDDEVELNGGLVISDKGMRGRGVVETHRSLTISKDILFRERSVSAQKGQFEILSDIVGKPALKSDYVDVEIDLDAQQATFNPSEEGYASNNFPYLKYRTSLNDGFWDIKKHIITMEKPEEMELKDSYFYSTHKKQDSISFNAEKAYYIIDSLKLLIEGVNFIEIADAKIFPDSSKLEIKENANIVTLKNARITLDTLNEYHNLIGNIHIDSKKDFSGNADYQFVTFKKDTLPIVFDEFKLEPVEVKKGNFEYHTVCRGHLVEEDSFLLAPKMFYKGDVIMYAHKRLLSLDGYIKLDIEDDENPLPWLRYKNDKDVDQIQINLDEQEDLVEREITTGLYYDGFGFGYYSTFLGTINEADDQEIFKSIGYLVYDPVTTEFKIIDSKRLDSTSFKGNIFSFSETGNYYDFLGELKLINPEPEIPHHFAFDFGGEAVHNLTDSTLKAEGLGVLNFEVSPNVMKQFGSRISLISKYYTNTVKPSRITDTLYARLGSVGTEKEIEKYVKLTSLNNVNPAKSFINLKTGIVFNDLDLEWDPIKKSWHSVGPLGIVSIAGYPVDCYLKGYLEIKKTPEEDQVNFYIEGGPGQWYYFGYSENALFITSSDQDLMKYVNSKNTEAKNLPKNLYYWAPAEEEDLTRFKRSFVRDYLGGKDVEVDASNIPAGEGDGGDFENFDEIDDEFGDEDEKDEFEEDDFDEIDEEDDFEELEDNGSDDSENKTQENSSEETGDENNFEEIDEDDKKADSQTSDDDFEEGTFELESKSKKKKKEKKGKKKKGKDLPEVEEVQDEIEENSSNDSDSEDDFEEIDEDGSDDFEEGN